MASQDQEVGIGTRYQLLINSHSQRQELINNSFLVGKEHFHLDLPPHLLVSDHRNFRPAPS